MWTQHTRSVNNDLTLVHEQALLDVAAGMVFLRERVRRGRHARALRRRPALRLLPGAGGPRARGAHRDAPPAGGPPGSPTPSCRSPTAPCSSPRTPARASCCWPASTRRSPTRPTRSPWCRSWTHSTQPTGSPSRRASSSYGAEFLARYRAAQRDRVARIDAVAREPTWPAPPRRGRRSRRAGPPPTADGRSRPRIITVFRTDADPRTVDLSIDPSDRPYGSLFGKRPGPHRLRPGRLRPADDPGGVALDVVGAVSSNADFVRCAPGVTVPTLFVELTGDQAAFPADSRRMVAALGAADLTHGRRARPALRGRHRRRVSRPATSSPPTRSPHGSGRATRGRPQPTRWAMSRRCIARVGRADGPVGAFCERGVRGRSACSGRVGVVRVAVVVVMRRSLLPRPAPPGQLDGRCTG